MLFFFVFFFFQAEDGIRDHCVTGVQTCALPICGLLGALIALSPKVIYPIYQQAGAPWGIDAIEDQQLAGIIMWIPAGVLFTVVGVALFAGWLGEAERRVALTRSESLRKEQP